MLSRKKRQGVRFWKTKRFKWSVLTVLVLLVMTVGAYAYFISNFVNDIQQGNKDNGDNLVQVEEWSGTERVNILLIGVDNRENDTHPRSDTMLLVSIDPQTKRANVMSVMRDTWFNIPDGYGYEKINAAHALGGPDLTIRTLKELMQIPIHYYAKTDFQGFIKIVDALGGVTIDVEKPLHYLDDGVYDIHLNAGTQKLDGTHALMYVRFRADAMADFARTERQRKFLASLADEMTSASALIKLPAILDAIEPFMETNMTMSDMIKLGKLALSVDSTDIESLQVPPREALREGYAGGGQAVLIPNVYETRKQIYAFLGMDTSLVKEDESIQPQEYYADEPVLPTNPRVDPVQPKPDPAKQQPEESKDKPVEGTKPAAGTKPADQGGGGGTTKPTDGTTPPTKPTDGTQPGTPTDGTTPPAGGTTPPPTDGTGGGDTTTPPPTGGGGTPTPPAGGGSGDTPTPPTGGTSTTPTSGSKPPGSTTSSVPAQ